ncbi:MAG: MBL fold metallo-hydrolase [Calditrichia bacterium]
MKFCVLASGSKGNSIFIESYHSRILVDAGLSAKKIRERLAQIDVDADSIDAIVVTHAHSDHVRGIGQFAFRYNAPVYAHPDTLDAIATRLKPNQISVPWEREFTINDFNFSPFRLSHDCQPTYGYLIRENSKSLAICTDLGMATSTVAEILQGADGLVLESNHDPAMLMNGPYAWYLKERIASRLGHLSNYDSGNLLNRVIHPRLMKVILGHLSDENNTGEIALSTVLEIVGARMEHLIEVIEQGQMSGVIDL